MSRSALDQVAIGDIVNGILLFMGNLKFSDQQLYRFFKRLSVEDPSLDQRLDIKSFQGRLHSDALRRILSFREMGKIIELSMPNPVDQFYRPRTSQMEFVRKDLIANEVLPGHEDSLRRLAEEFTSTLH